jgi:RCR-type E3 ubiquitin transferase
VLLTSVGEVFTFGSNQYGQLGTGDLQPVSVPVQVKIPGMASQVWAGSNHTVVLSTKGIVFTFGNFQKGQLGRLPSDINAQESTACNSNDPFSNLNDFQSDNILAQRQRYLWHCIPTPITGIGPSFRKKACWISASGDQTFIKVDESLVNSSSLDKISVAANKNTLIFISNNEGVPGCITINKQDGKCRTHVNNQYLFHLNFDETFEEPGDEVSSSNSSGREKSLRESYESQSTSSSPSSATTSKTIFAIDPLYDVLWCFDVAKMKMLCFNILASKSLGQTEAIFKSDVALPNKNVINVTRVHACLNVLACLDTLAFAQNSLDTCFESSIKKKNVKTQMIESTKDSKETKKICRFEAFGGGWGYFGHSVEAIRFMCDTDILMYGIGMYGGRGEYTCKIKIFDLGADGCGLEKEGAVIFELDDVPYYCPARTIHNILFQKPVNIVAGKW